MQIRQIQNPLSILRYLRALLGQQLKWARIGNFDQADTFVDRIEKCLARLEESQSSPQLENQANPHLSAHPQLKENPNLIAHLWQQCQSIHEQSLALYESEKTLLFKEGLELRLENELQRLHKQSN